jgi:hypothetical protein
MKTNITIRIDDSLAHEAKVLAAKRGTSLSRLIAEELMAMVSRDEAYQVARFSALNDIQQAPALGYSGAIDRDSLHDR